MGMYDIVTGVEEDCPDCGKPIEGGHWQSKWGPCELLNLDFRELDGFRGYCHACKLSIDYTYRDDTHPENRFRQALERIATGYVSLKGAQAEAMLALEGGRELEHYERHVDRWGLRNQEARAREAAEREEREKALTRTHCTCGALLVRVDGEFYETWMACTRTGREQGDCGPGVPVLRDASWVEHVRHLRRVDLGREWLDTETEQWVRRWTP